MKGYRAVFQQDSRCPAGYFPPRTLLLRHDFEAQKSPTKCQNAKKLKE